MAPPGSQNFSWADFLLPIRVLTHHYRPRTTSIKQSEQVIIQMEIDINKHLKVPRSQLCIQAGLPAQECCKVKQLMQM